MELILNNRNTNLLNLNNNTFDKYLCPHVFFYMGETYLFCSRRKKYFSEESDIGVYKLDIDKKKCTFVYNIIPKNFFKSKYNSFLSPYVVSHKKNFYCFIQAKKKYSKKSKLLVLQSKNFKNWFEFKHSLKISRSIETPSIFKNRNNIFLICSSNYKKIFMFDLILKKGKIIIKSEKEVNTSKIKNFFLNYSPQLNKIKKKYYLFRAEWINKKKSSLIIDTSNDLIKWKLSTIVLSKKKNKLISEPFFKKINNKNYLFFEYKIKKKWNIAYTCMSNKLF